MYDQAIEFLNKDAVLARFIQTVDPKKNLMVTPSSGAADVYFTLLESIVSQQLSVKASDTIFQRFISLYPANYPSAELLFGTETEKLRSVGLSFQKAAYLKNVAAFALNNDLSYETLNQFSDEEIISLLTQIKGVGRWTVEMLLMFTMNRPDVFPYDDLVIRNNIIKLYQIEGKGAELKKKIFSVAENWRPYRTLACKYIWKWKDTFLAE